MLERKIDQPNFIETKILFQNYLNSLYDQVFSHQVKNNLAETGGEILYESMTKLLSIVPFTAQDVFYDLGSGVGKTVLQVYLNTPVKSAYGIEMIEESHQKATKAAELMKKELAGFYQAERGLHFLNGNFLEIPFMGATIVLVNSVCFNQKLLIAIEQVINKTDSIHTVLTTRPMSHLKNLKFKKAVRVECSWDTALCYIYTAF